MDFIRKNWLLILIGILVYCYYKKLWIFKPDTPAAAAAAPVVNELKEVAGMFFDDPVYTSPGTGTDTATATQSGSSDNTGPAYLGPPNTATVGENAGKPAETSGKPLSGFNTRMRRRTPFLNAR